MASAAEWVRQTVASSQNEPMTTEAVLKSLERHVGQGDRARERVQAILEYIDGELIERRGGLAMRDLWATVTDYLEKVQESLAAA
jgi:hypothetical protein